MTLCEPLQAFYKHCTQFPMSVFTIILKMCNVRCTSSFVCLFLYTFHCFTSRHIVNAQSCALTASAWVQSPSRPSAAMTLCVTKRGNATSFGWDVKPRSSLCSTPNMDYKDPDITEEVNLWLPAHTELQTPTGMGATRELPSEPQRFHAWSSRKG